MKINKDTEVYGSISENPGNFGASMHNFGFEYYEINAIYKPFGLENRGVDNFNNFLNSLENIGVKGLGISMPYKRIAYHSVEFMDENTKAIRNINTILFKNGRRIGINTDYLAAKYILETPNTILLSNTNIKIIGKGALADTWRYTIRQICKYDPEMIDSRSDLKEFLNNDIMAINCTPLIFGGKKIINASIETYTGQQLALIQGAHQFELYTGRPFPLDAYNKL